MLAGDPEAEDIAQQALLAVFDRASEYDPAIGPALPWILGIAGWTVRSHRKRCARRRETDVPTGLVHPDDLEEAAIRRDLEAAVRAVLGDLSDLDRATLHAAVTDRPSGAAFRKRLQRALERLRTTFRRRHGAL
ncbi:MAG: sigma-70 family RNA polymerase sigma factor [Alphaproteobacteria bacterium]|nr:sigma-70 family RNA polymerase sigma factor [Alphaproteobacteria bacterium]